MKKSMIYNYTANELCTILKSGKSLFEGVELSEVALPFGMGDPVFDPALYGEDFSAEVKLDPEGYYCDDDEEEEDQIYRGDWSNDPENIPPNSHGTLRAGNIDSSYADTDGASAAIEYILQFYRNVPELLEEIKAHAAANPALIDRHSLEKLAYIPSDFVSALMFYSGKDERCDAVDRFEAEFLRSPLSYCERFIQRFVEAYNYGNEIEWHLAFYAEYKMQTAFPVFPPRFLEIFEFITDLFCAMPYGMISAMKDRTGRE